MIRNSLMSERIFKHFIKFVSGRLEITEEVSMDFGLNRMMGDLRAWITGRGERWELGGKVERNVGVWEERLVCLLWIRYVESFWIYF